jgi:hypothetical protein
MPSPRLRGAALLVFASVFPLVPTACGSSDSNPDGGGSGASTGSSAGTGSASTGTGAGSGTSSGGSASSGSASGAASGAASGSTSGGSGASSGSSTSGTSGTSGGGTDAGPDGTVSGNDAASSGGSGDAHADTASGGANKFDYLVMILMENHSLGEIYGPATYMTQFADGNALLQKYSAVDHPSEPNYLALVSAQTFNPPSGDDLYHVFSGTNLVDRLESIGKTWRAYSESATKACDTTNVDVRHVPFLFFSDVATNATRCARVVPTSPTTDAEVIAELNSTTPSNFIWLTPNDAHNMHSAPVATGDAYLMNLVPQILASTTFTTKKAALFIVFDEGSGSLTAPNDLVYAVWAGPVVKKALKSMTAYTHYSVLATLAANWGFPAIGTNDSSATSMMEVFQ